MKHLTICTSLICTLSLFTHCLFAQPEISPRDIDQFIQAKFDQDNLPGLAVAVVHQDKIIFSKGYGKDSQGKPITGDSPFAIASLSKAFTAMAVMQLAETNKINLDAPLISYLPSLRIDDDRKAKMTIRHLLNQTSGLSDRVFPDIKLSDQPDNLDEALRRLDGVKLTDEPGQQFRYHNPNYELLAKLVEVVSKETFSNYLNNHILKTAGMHHTWSVSNTRLFNADQDFSNGHFFFFGMPVAKKESPWFVEGAAGLVSTANDMARWLLVHLNNGTTGGMQLVNKESLNQMYLPPKGLSSPYGMGWFVDDQGKLYHGGSLWTYSAEQIVLPKERYGIVVLFNSGVTAFADYYSYVQGLEDLVKNKQPETSALPNWVVEMIIFIILLSIAGIGLYRLVYFESIRRKYERRANWLNWFFILLRLLPLFLFFFIPQLWLLLTGRALIWEGFVLMMPSIFIGIGLIALVNLILVGRLIPFIFHKA